MYRIPTSVDTKYLLPHIKSAEMKLGQISFSAVATETTPPLRRYESSAA